jgi:hypothetical protein
VAEQTADEASQAARAQRPPLPQCLQDVCASPCLGGSLPLYLLDLMKDEHDLLGKHLVLLDVGRSSKIVRPSVPASTRDESWRTYG